MKKQLLTVLFLAVLGTTAFAQGGDYATVKGSVLEAGTNIPVDYATVHILPQGVLGMTDQKGMFSFEKINVGRVNIKIDFLGMKSIDTTLTIRAGINEFKFQMTATSFRLAEVSVVAKESKAGQSTSSTISRQAMDHLRTISVSDVMSLLPGGQINATNLSTAQMINIRTAQQLNISGELQDSPENSRGALIVVDGAPISNNANLQAINPTIVGSSVPVGGGTRPNAGIDLRSLSVDNIESIEVIRGIASAAYGDLTSGAVIIQSKAGKEPLKINFKTDPGIYSTSISKGIVLGEKTGSLNLSGDYTYGTTRLYESYYFYERITAKGLYSNVFGKLSSNTSLDLNYNKDTRKLNPNDARTRSASSASNLGVRFNTNGSINNINWGMLNNIRYTLSGSYADKKSHNEELLGNAMAGYSTNLTDGAIITNKPGQKVYDVNNKELTSIPPAEMNSFFTSLPNEYFCAYDVLGKEVNIFAKITANLSKKIGNVHNRVLIGIDYKLDGNLGEGKVYDINNPPYRVLSSENSSPRPRKFSDIPFVHQFSAYIEENMNWLIGARELTLQAGLRFDQFNSKNIIAPRVNVGFSIVPQTLSIRASYGVMAKAPATIYLYPDKAYFDFVHFNTLDRVGVPVEEQLLMGSTKVLDVDNSKLKIESSTTYELGFDLKINKMRFAVTAYDRKVKNGYTLSRDIDCYKLVEYKQYAVGENRPGQIPLLQESGTYNLFIHYAKPMNTAKSIEKGIEYDFDLGRFDAIRTSFVVSGAYMRSTLWNDNDGYRYSLRSNGNELERNIGIYEAGVYKDEYERLNTTIRATHNIPAIGFVLTLATQITWIDKIWNTYGNDTMFEKYISRLDGKVYDFNPAMKDDPEFRYLFVSRNDNRFIVESRFPTVIFNVTLTKEISDIIRASFNVNNMFNSRPLYESKRNPGSFRQLNIPISFGFALEIKLK